MARVCIIGDTHAPGMLKRYPEFVRDTADQWDCDKFVHIGDFVDWHAINFHGKTPGTPSVDHEVEQSREQVSQVTSLFPECEWLIGNHDALPARHAEASGLPTDILRSEADYWNLPSGWNVHERFSHIEIDGVLYAHGECGPQGDNGARNQAKANFQSTVIGHLHQCSGVSWVANRNKRVFGMSAGCGIDHQLLQFAYGRKFKNKPIISCGIVIDGEFAYVEPMPLEKYK